MILSVKSGLSGYCPTFAPGILVAYTRVEDTQVEDTRVEDTRVEDSRVEDTRVEDILVEDTLDCRHWDNLQN